MVISIKNSLSLASKIVPSDVRTTTAKLTGAMKSGYKIGRRCNRINNADVFASTKTSTKSVSRKIRKLKFTKEERPALIAAIWSLLPIPSPIPTTPIVYGVGKLVNKFLKIIGK